MDTKRGTCHRQEDRTVAYEYRFQGEMPTVRGGQYEEARDLSVSLVRDDEGWLLQNPRCCLAADAP